MVLHSRTAVFSGRHRLGIAALLLGAMLNAPHAAAAVGRTSGNFNVSPSGTASYSIPIFTPPGPNGAQPSVALVYSSTGGVGYVGRGWSVAGFSSIDRCNKTIAQDGVEAPVSLVAADGYCLDGNRLKLQSGGYGGNGSIWATEIADFSRVTATATGWNGPDSWTVEHKDGTTWTYGTTTGSSVLVGDIANTWYVSQIADRAGNKIRFTYKAADTYTTGVTHPTKIEWTQTSAGSGSYVYSMEFTYSSNGNVAQSTYTGYVAGTEIHDTDLLASISVKNSTTTVRKYVLAYDTSPTTGAKRLTSVTECSDAALSDCLSPTTISYQNGQAGIASTPSSSSSISSATSHLSGDADYNADGINDLTYYRDGAWYVRFGSTSGYGSEVATGVTEFILMTFDPFGNGRTSILGRIGYHYSATWHAYQWNGTSFQPASLGLTDWDLAFQYITARDVDGDGRDDLVYATAVEIYTGIPSNPYGSVMAINVLPSTSTGSTLSFGTVVQSGYVPSTLWETGGVGPLLEAGDLTYQGRSELDLNGDERGDLLVQGMYYYLLYDPWNDYWYYDWLQFNAALVATDDFQFVEFIADTSGDAYAMSTNSDGCIDFYSAGQVTPSSCSGSGTVFYTAGPIVGATDWDGDGRQDLLVSISGTTYVQLSTGQGLSSPQTTGIPSCSGFFGDANGDSLDDYICRNGTSLQVYLRNDSTVQPDLAVSFTDGFGVNQTVAYVFSTYTGYSAYGNASYPQVDITSPMVLVRTVTSTDGVGGTYTNTYSYFGATEDPTRYGFEGFEKIEVVDSRNSVKRTQRFKREFPYSGAPFETSTYQSGGTLMNSKSITMTYMTLDATTYKQRYFPYSSSSIMDVYEVGGTKNGDWITRTTTSSTFDTWGNMTASTTVVTDKDSSSPLYGQSWTKTTAASFSPSTTYWCLGLPTDSSVTSSTTVSGESNVTRSKSYTPDYANCRMSAESIEPSSSTLRVDTSYGYDGFGNVNSVSVTGRNPNATSMSARSTGIGWGTTGQFPVSEANALGQTTTRTFHSTFGSLLTETDPNGIVVGNNTYDSFGRIYLVERADGTRAYTSYHECSVYGCENGDPASGVTGINKAIVMTAEYDSSSSLIGYHYVHTDQFDRPIVEVSQIQSISGAWMRIGRQYDALGRVQRETAPCSYYGCAVYWTTNTYDLLGRITQQSRPRSDSDATAVTTTFAYAGRTQTVTDPNSKISTKVLDVNGWLRRSRDHDNYGQNFSYDSAGSLIGVTDTASNSLFGAAYYYGAKPLQYSTSDMDLGSWSYTYNSLGELVSWTDAKSQSFSQTYDVLSRVLTRTESEGTTTWTYGTSAGSHNIGRLAGVSMTDYSEALSYDSVGRPSTRSITADGNTYDLDTAYNNQGLLDTLTYPESTSSTRVKVKYGYAYGILQSVTDWTSGSAGTVYWTANAQNPRGQTAQETLGNGVVTNRSFDAITGWLNSIQSGVSGGTGLQNQSYAYDKIGNVTQRQENSLGLTENFYYDNLYRLDYSTLNTGGGAVTNLDLTYDPAGMGNITARSDVNGNATWTYHGTKKHAVASTGTGGVTYSYDANGNMVSRAGQTINWSSFNYPTYLSTAAENTTFYYGPDRQYYRQDYNGPSGSETTYYIGGVLEKVCPSTSCASGTIDWRHYIQAEGQTVAIVSRKSTGTNVVNYPLEDNQGSGSTLTDSSGSLLVRESFNAFGLPRDGADWDGAVSSGDLTTLEGISRRGYTGHSMLGRMGLIHMNGRVQDAVTGRFLSPDPNVFQPGFTQAYNRYSYVSNNPLRYIDPTGFCTEEDGRVDDCEVLPDVEVTGTRRRSRSEGCMVTRIGCDYYVPPSPFGNSDRLCSRGFGPECLASFQTTNPECGSVYGWNAECEEAAAKQRALEEQVRRKILEVKHPKPTAHGQKGPPAPPQVTTSTNLPKKTIFRSLLEKAKRFFKPAELQKEKPKERIVDFPGDSPDAALKRIKSLSMDKAKGPAIGAAKEVARKLGVSDAQICEVEHCATAGPRMSVCLMTYCGEELGLGGNDPVDDRR